MKSTILQIRIDPELKKEIKKYSYEKRVSVTELITSYFQKLIKK